MKPDKLSRWSRTHRVQLQLHQFYFPFCMFAGECVSFGRRRLQLPVTNTHAHTPSMSNIRSGGQTVRCSLPQHNQSSTGLWLANKANFLQRISFKLIVSLGLIEIIIQGRNMKSKKTRGNQKSMMLELECANLRALTSRMLTKPKLPCAYGKILG